MNKKELKRLQNRESARRSRKRKQDELLRLETENLNLKDENIMLKCRNEELEEDLKDVCQYRKELFDKIAELTITNEKNEEYIQQLEESLRKRDLAPATDIYRIQELYAQDCQLFPEINV